MKQVIAFYILIAATSSQRVFQTDMGSSPKQFKTYTGPDYGQDNEVFRPRFYNFFKTAKKPFWDKKYKTEMPTTDDIFFWKKIKKQGGVSPSFVMQYPAYPKTRKWNPNLPNPNDIDDEDILDRDFIPSPRQMQPYPREAAPAEPALCHHNHSPMENMYRQPSYDFNPYDGERELEDDLDTQASSVFPRTMPMNPRSGGFPFHQYPPMVFHPVHHPYNPFFFVFPKNEPPAPTPDPFEP